MADNTAEQISALVDGECEETEVELLLHSLTRDPDLKACWQCYHLISDAIKNNIPEVIDPDFAERIIKVIDTSNSTRTHSPPALPSWYKPVTGFTLAASIATVALVGMKFIQRDETLKPGSIAAVSPVEQRATEQVINDTIRRAHLNRYVVNHNEYASMNSVHGMLPYVRMVGDYEPER